MPIYGSTCMPIYSGIGQYMSIYGGREQPIYEGIARSVYGCIGQYMAIYGGIGQYIAVLGRYIPIDGDTWQCVSNHGCIIQ